MDCIIILSNIYGIIFLVWKLYVLYNLYLFFFLINSFIGGKIINKINFLMIFNEEFYFLYIYFDNEFFINIVGEILVNIMI